MAVRAEAIPYSGSTLIALAPEHFAAIQRTVGLLLPARALAAPFRRGSTPMPSPCCGMRRATSACSWATTSISRRRVRA